MKEGRNSCGGSSPEHIFLGVKSDEHQRRNNRAVEAFKYNNNRSRSSPRPRRQMTFATAALMEEPADLLSPIYGLSISIRARIPPPRL